MTRTGCGLLSCPSDSEVLEEKRVEARFVSLDPFASREDGTDEGKRGVVAKGLRSRRELHWRREAKEIHQRQAIFSYNSREARTRKGRCWDDHRLKVRGNDVEVQGRPAGQHSRTKPRGQDEKGARAGTIV